MANINTLLVILVIIAVVTSIGGTLVTISRLQPAWLMITGEVTEGTLQFEIQTIAIIDVPQPTVNFGAGMVNETKVSCTIATNDSAANSTYGNWTGYYGETTKAFKIENTGSVDINITINSNVTASTFIGGNNPTQKYGVANVSGEENACENSSLAQWAWLTLGTVAAGTNVCEDMQHEAGNDELYINMQLKIPEDAAPGSKSSKITFIARAAA